MLLELYETLLLEPERKNEKFKMYFWVFTVSSLYIYTQFFLWPEEALCCSSFPQSKIVHASLNKGTR